MVKFKRGKKTDFVKTLRSRNTAGRKAAAVGKGREVKTTTTCVHRNRADL